MNDITFNLSPAIKTDQDAFDAVVNYLSLKTDGQSADSTAQCLYYIPETGNRCAIGHLIEAKTIEELRVLASMKCSVHGFQLGQYIVEDTGREDFDFSGPKAYLNIPTELSREVLTGLQQAHDNRANWTENRFNGHGFRELRGIAVQHNLNTQHLDSAMELRLNGH